MGMTLESRAREITKAIFDKLRREHPADLALAEPEVQQALEGYENEFVLRIQLGDNHMRSMRDVAFALSTLIARLRRGSVATRNPDARTIEFKETGTIFDINGNSVGGWQYHRKD